MRVSRIRNNSSIGVPPNLVTQRLQAVREGLRRYGAVALKDTKIDREVIARLQKQFGEENVVVEKSNTLKVTVANFRR